MEAFQFSDRTVTRLISELEKAGYIIRDIIKDSEGKVMQRRIYLRESALHGLPPDKNDGGCQNCRYPPDKIGGENNISSDNKKKILKEKTPKPKAESLTDEQLQAIFKDWIHEIAQESWGRGIKNRLWQSLCDFYSPRTQSKNNPERSIVGVNALKRQLIDYSGGYPEKMCMILDTALNRGYRGIIPLNETKVSPSASQSKSSGGDYDDI